MIVFYAVLALFLVGIILAFLAIRVSTFQWKQTQIRNALPNVQYSHKIIPEILPETTPEVIAVAEPIAIQTPVIAVSPLPENLPQEPIPSPEIPVHRKESRRKKWLRNWMMGEMMDL